ncbi:hypothetical protein [Variovorax sp. tm]|uniref:hypothetical protein n=1 Tax=Variovorax atrisoli TaxID=3394203 RepID=UPI003A7FE77C
MDGQIIPLGLVRKEAAEAAQKQSCPHAASPWPVGTAAGQLFVQEFHAARALAQASERLRQEGQVA